MSLTFRYRSGYKYQLLDKVVVNVSLRPRDGITCALDRFLELDPDGKLTIWAGYAWDGPSGPTFDTSDFMGPSLVHDALYQLGDAGLLEDGWRLLADETLEKACELNGMTFLRKWYVYKAVRLFGGLWQLLPTRSNVQKVTLETDLTLSKG